MRSYKNIIEVYVSRGKLDIWKRNDVIHIDTGLDTIELTPMELNDLINALREITYD
jgi:hypothetical protein